MQIIPSSYEDQLEILVNEKKIDEKTKSNQENQMKGTLMNLG